MLDLGRRSLRNRTTAWLLACGLLLGQFALYLHHFEHALHGDNDACSLCLIGEHTGAAPLAATPPTIAAAGRSTVAFFVLPAVPRCELHAFRARAPPELLPS